MNPSKRSYTTSHDTKHGTCWDLLADKDFPKKVILEKLLRHRLGVSKTQLLAHPETPLTSDDKQRIIDAYTAHVKKHKPIEYIIGHVEFLGVQFAVNSDTLIPRPETEYMINAIREFFTENNLNNPQSQRGLFDIGTGCGVLGLSVLSHVGKELFSDVVCSDISPEALVVAETNWKRLFSTQSTHNTKKIDKSADTVHKKPYFIVADLFNHTIIQETRKKLFASKQPLLIVANLPYIPQDLFDTNTDKSVHDREPEFAFVGGDDGLDWYRKQFDQILKLENNYPLGAVQFLEMMTRQVDILQEEYGNHFTFESVKTFHFNIRIVKVIPC